MYLHEIDPVFDPIAPQQTSGLPFCHWGDRAVVREIRRLGWDWVIVPVLRRLAPARVTGLEELGGLRGPVIFASNHLSHVDSHVILAAMPAPFRYRVAPTMCDACFQSRNPVIRLWHAFRYYTTVLFANAFTLPRNLEFRQALRHIAYLAGAGWSVLVFPEGERSVSGNLLPLQPGTGVAAVTYQLPVVPVRVDDTQNVIPPGRGYPLPAQVRIRFGRPIFPGGMDPSQLTERLSGAMQELASASQGKPVDVAGMVRIEEDEADSDGH